MAGLGGMKAAAKRTVFGDVSNTAKQMSSAYDDSVIASKAINIDYVKPLAIPDKSAALLRPAQRPLTTAAKNAINSAIPQPEPALHLIAPLAESRQSQVSIQPGAKRTLSKRSTTIYNDNIENQPQVSATNFESAPIAPVHQHLGPRHIKSQPQLKQEAPVLRRTQSKHVTAQQEETANQIDPANQEANEAQTFDASMENYDSHMRMTDETLAEVAVESLLLAHDTGLQSRQLPAPPLVSEPEEYWEEEEEEVYDDQGYTTAHSYRSRGDNTTGGATTVLFPKVTNKVKKELAAAKELVESLRSPEDVEDELWDTSMVAEYGDEIFAYMRDLEVSLRYLRFCFAPIRRLVGVHAFLRGRSCNLFFVYAPHLLCLSRLLTGCPLQIKMLPNPHYMDNQAEIQWSMRSVLMDWLIQVHARFGLLPETLFLTVNYIDRFLSCKIVSLGKLQLVGATAIFVAAKYEEINCPSVGEIVYMVDSGYTVDEILKAERFMLSMLQFELGWPGPMSFLRRISKADDYDLETRTLAKYFLEVTIMDERFVGSPPSYIAAGAHALSRFMLKKGEWVSFAHWFLAFHADIS